MVDRSSDPVGLGRGPVRRRLPVLWLAPTEPPALQPFDFTPELSSRRFTMRVLLSAKRFTIPAALGSISHQLCESMVPVVMGLAIDRALATGDIRQLGLWLVLLGLLFAVLSSSFRAAAKLTMLATSYAEHRLRITLSQRLLHRTGANSRQPSPNVISLMTNDVEQFEMGISVFAVGETAAVIFIASSLLWIHPVLGLTVVVGAPLVVALMGLASRRYAASRRTFQGQLAQTVGRASDLIGGYRVIKGMRAEAEGARRYRAQSQQTRQAAFRMSRSLGWFMTLSGTLIGAFVAGVAGLSGWLALDGQLSVGQLIAAVGLSQILLPPLRMLSFNASRWAVAEASGARILKALRESDHGSQESARTTTAAPALVAVPTLELAFAGRESVRVDAGELVGIRTDDVTGAQLVDTLLHYARPGPISVLIDGVPVAEVPEPEYRARVVVAPHESEVFSGTISTNLELVGASAELQDRALTAASCDDFVSDEPVGEGGNRLSGGQRQRVAMARALASDAPILVVHDPTTAVDSMTEAAIALRLSEMRRGKTTIVIASSPAMLGVCDRVIDLEPVVSAAPARSTAQAAR